MVCWELAANLICIFFNYEVCIFLLSVSYRIRVAIQKQKHITRQNSSLPCINCNNAQPVPGELQLYRHSFGIFTIKCTLGRCHCYSDRYMLSVDNFQPK